MAHLSLFRIPALADSSEQEYARRYGGKATQLARLAGLDIVVPETWTADPNELELWESSGEGVDTSSLPLMPWIVRSSANLEDSSSQSYAGFFESVRVDSLSNLSSSIRRVISTRPDALKNRTDLRIHFIIQPYIEAQQSGVAFSRDPKNLWSKAGRVEWVNGHLAALVHGEITPDSATLSEIVRQRPEFGIPLARCLEQLEQHFGRPVDVEWIWTGSQLVIVQCRPIATYEAEWVSRIESDEAYVRDEAIERFPEAMSPLGWTAIAEQLGPNLAALTRYYGIRPLRTDRFAISFAGWIYHRKNAFAYPNGVKLLASHLFSSLFPWTELLAIFFQSPIAFFRTSRFRAWLKFRIGSAFTERVIRKIRGEWGERKSRFDRALSDLNPENESESISFKKLRAMSEDFFEPDVAIFLSREILFKSLSAYIDSIGVSRDDWLKWVSQYAGNRTRVFSEDYARLARGEIEADQFWSDYGHIRFSWDIAAPSIGENRSFSQAGSPAQVPSSASPVQWDQLFPGHIFDAKKLKQSAESLHQILEIDEELHFLTGKALVPSREIALNLGNRFVEEGRLDSQNDVFFLEVQELRSGSISREDYRDRVRERRRVWALYAKSAPYSQIPPTQEISRKDLNSFGASPGVVEGEVIVLESPPVNPSQLQGKILVTSGPNPSWSPLFPILGGMICETGGILAHGFVAAREQRFPAVAHCIGACTTYKNGMRVRIDGSQGTVEIL